MPPPPAHPALTRPSPRQCHVQDLGDLERRCQAAELRYQEQSAKLPETARPLLRQIEAMQVGAALRGERRLLPPLYTRYKYHTHTP